MHGGTQDGPLHVVVQLYLHVHVERVVHLEMKGKADSNKFTRPIKLVVGAIIKQSGNKLLSAYTRNDAIQFRDSLIWKTSVLPLLLCLRLKQACAVLKY